MSNEPACDSAQDPVRDRLSTLVDDIALNDSRIRRQAPDGVHGMRVTLRRLRSVLATFGPLYDASAVPPLREDLKWVGSELGGARDAEVLRTRIGALVTSEPERALAEQVGARLARTEAAGVANAVEVLDSDRYSRTLAALTAFTESMGETPDAPGDAQLRRRVRKDWKRLRRRAEAADRAEGAEQETALHEVRKAAKRLRYSAETLVPSHGDDARRLARRAKRVQSALGDLQDSVVMRVRLRGLAEQPGWTPREAFGLGVLHGREEARAAAAGAAYDDAWRRLSRKKHRRWLG